MAGKIDVAVVGPGKMGAAHVKAAVDSPHINKIYGYEPEKNRPDNPALLAEYDHPHFCIMAMYDIEESTD